MNAAQVIALINQYITSNGIGAITGPILNQVLQAIVNLFTATYPPAQTVTTSTLFTFTLSMFRVGFQRTLNVAAFNVQLPAGALVGQEFVIQDLQGNFQSYPVTVLPPAGQTITGRPSYTISEDFGTARFTYYGSSLWGVEAG